MQSINTALGVINDLAQTTPNPPAIPSPVSTAPPGSGGIVSILGWLKWVCLGAAVGALFIIGAKMGFDSRRGEGSEHAGALVKVLIGVVIIGAAGALVGFLAT